jgi:hypothetical protein
MWREIVMKLSGLLILAAASLSGAALCAQDVSVGIQSKLTGGWRGQITGEQLEQMLAADNREPDKRLAKRLSEMDLTERLSPARLTRCEASLRGSDSRRALRTLADRSAFLDLPPAEIPAIAEPDPEAQSKMLALTVQYVSKVIHQLPNLYATRVAASFVQDKKPLHWVSTESAIVHYRDGQDIFASSEFHAGSAMTTAGEFGPILSVALLDSAQANLTWSHWEQGAAAPEAVYHYAVNAAKSHFNVDGQFPGYHGEITIDPSNGSILRLVMRADPEPSLPLRRADVMVEYGPVELAGKVYICPLRGVALSAASKQWWLNDVVFEQYHLFHASARVLPESSELP